MGIPVRQKTKGAQIFHELPQKPVDIKRIKMIAS
jgi:hypothetical protein